MKQNIRKVLLFNLIFLTVIIFAFIATIMLHQKCYTTELHLSDFQRKVLYVGWLESCKIEKYKNENTTNAILNIDKIEDENVEIVDFYIHDDNIYIDEIVYTENGEIFRLIIRKSKLGISKFLYDTEGNVVINNNNKEIVSKNLNFKQLNLETDNDTVFDPFINESFIFHDKKLTTELVENIGDKDRLVRMCVYESIGNPSIISGEYVVFKKGSNVVDIALSMHTIISDVFKWIPENMICHDDTLKEDVKLYTKKHVYFLYEREVEFEFLDNNETRKILENCERGEATVSINYKNLVNSGENSFIFEITQRPLGLSLCDVHYIEQAKKKYLSSSFYNNI